MPESDVGSYFGKFFLLKKLAAGGMGEVFLAKLQAPGGFEKILIIKKVLSHLAENKEFIELFLSEARLAARMNHRNIVQVFELGEQDGSYFIAMEYVQGKSLRDVIDAAIKRKEKIPGELCRSVVEQICDGSSYAHNLTDVSGRSLNIVHRDLNPQNVLVSYTGDVKVIDFGIAKSEMSTVKTEAGMIKGKFVYMSPEQSLAKKLDRRSDIFPIGITLYEMLTGINPFAKNNIVLTLEAVQRYDPPPVSDYDPAYAPFDPIIAKALAKDRDRRYSDASEMQDDLRRIVLPPAPERLGVFMSRLFRQQLEEEQKVLKDTDSAQVTSAAKMGPRTPSKPAPAHPAPQGDGATMMLPPQPKAGARAPSGGKGVPAPRPAPKAPAPPPKKQGAGDTLMDMAAPISPPSGSDDVSGATAFLTPGAALPPPPTRAAPKAPSSSATPQAPPRAPQPDDGGGATAFLPAAAARQEKARKSPPSVPTTPVNAGSTNILTPEEASAAQRDALAKMEARGGTSPGRQQAQRARTHPPAPAKSKKGLFIALGLGALLLVGGVITVVALSSGDDRPAPRKAKVVPVEPPPEAPAPEVKEAPAPPPPAPVAPKPEKKEPEKKEEAPNTGVKPPEKLAPTPEKPAAVKAPSAGKLLGSFTVNPGPNVPVSFNGTLMPKVSGAQRLPIAAESGTVEVGDASTQFKVTFDYAHTGKELVLKVKSDPWSILSVDHITKGKTPPVAEVHVGEAMVVVEFKKPGQDTGMAVRLLFKGN